VPSTTKLSTHTITRPIPKKKSLEMKMDMKEISIERKSVPQHAAALRSQIEEVFIKFLYEGKKTIIDTQFLVVANNAQNNIGNVLRVSIDAK
jgi:hypothetical protein